MMKKTDMLRVLNAFLKVRSSLQYANDPLSSQHVARDQFVREMFELAKELERTGALKNVSEEIERMIDA